MLFAVEVMSTSKGESTYRSEISKLPENAPATEIIDIAMDASKETRRVLVRAMVKRSISFYVDCQPW